MIELEVSTGGFAHLEESWLCSDFQEAEFLREAKEKEGKSYRSHSPFPPLALPSGCINTGMWHCTTPCLSPFLTSTVVEPQPAKHPGSESDTWTFLCL